MKQMRIIGSLMAVYAIVMLALLATPARDWALEHSIAHLVSRTDRRVGNTVDGAVDMPMAIAGSAVVAFAGLWFAILVPMVFKRQRGAMERIIADNMQQRATQPMVAPNGHHRNPT
jgi:hypothetical protein